MNGRCWTSSPFRQITHKQNKMSNHNFFFFVSFFLLWGGGECICDLSTRENPQIHVNPNWRQCPASSQRCSTCTCTWHWRHTVFFSASCDLGDETVGFPSTHMTNSQYEVSMSYGVSQNTQIYAVTRHLVSKLSTAIIRSGILFIYLLQSELSEKGRGNSLMDFIGESDSCPLFPLFLNVKQFNLYKIHWRLFSYHPSCF